MTQTTRLYWNDPYQKEFEAKILDVIDTEFGQAIILDQTCFYAESGGQTGDTGTLNGQRVRDTRYSDDSKTVIYHYMEETSSFQKGDSVMGTIDWDRRHQIMKNHSLVHVLDLVFQKHYGKQECIGSNVNEKKGRVDYEFFDPIDIEALTKDIQELLNENHKIHCEADESDSNKRIWIMDDFAEMPCGGTHPNNTSEMGEIRLKRKSLGKQGQRIYCVTGV